MAAVAAVNGQQPALLTTGERPMDASSLRPGREVIELGPVSTTIPR